MLTNYDFLVEFKHNVPVEQDKEKWTTRQGQYFSEDKKEYHTFKDCKQ